LRWRGNQRIAGHAWWGLLVLSGKVEHQAEGENKTYGQPYEGLSDGFHGFSIRWFDFLRAFLPGLEPPATPGKNEGASLTHSHSREPLPSDPSVGNTPGRAIARASRRSPTGKKEKNIWQWFSE
jgi:hypothetical protein